jgi:hypothetical protein
MRTVKYKRHWSNSSRGVRRKGLLVEFVLDVIYLMDLGIVPPFHILNEVLQDGGHDGGMGPGTSWQPFTISEAEYKELVEALLKLDVVKAKKQHPYIRAEKIIIDETLHDCKTFGEWLRNMTKKYS